MVTRNPTTQAIIRPGIPAQTAMHYIYIGKGQSNDTGSAAAELVNTTDPTYGATQMMGRDMRGDRTGVTTPLSGATGTWADQTDTLVPPDGCALLTFTGLPNSVVQEPNRAYSREVFAYEVAKVLNKRQIKKNGQRHTSHFVTFGHTGYAMSKLVKGTHAYTNAINGATKLYNSLIANGVSAANIVFAGILWVHGEADFNATGSGYAAAEVQLARDLNTDLKAINSQTALIPMFTMQQSNFCINGSSPRTIIYPVLEQLQAHISYPGEVICCGPMYSSETIGGTLVSDPSNLHAYGHQAIRWARAMGNAVATVVIDGNTWNPLMPRKITRSGLIVDVQYFVPSGSLVLDTTYVTNTADGQMGFDLPVTGGASASVPFGISLLSSDTVRHNLARAIDGTLPYMRGGRNPLNAGTPSGPRTGARTCLRDSADALAQYCNFCCHYNIPVPPDGDYAYSSDFTVDFPS